MNKIGTGKQDLQAEIKWHEGGFYIDSGHWTSHSIFASRERHWLAVETQIRLFPYLKYFSNGLGWYCEKS